MGKIFNIVWLKNKGICEYSIFIPAQYMK